MLAYSQYRDAAMPINTGGTVTHEFYFPKAARIKKYFVVPAVAQAAHATIVVSATFINKGTDGSGSTTLALFTNDSDDENDLTTVVGAWVAHDAAVLNCEDRPGAFDNDTDVADEIAAGTVIAVAVTGAGTTPTANQLTVGVEFVESD